MTPRLIFRPEASDELDQARRYYEQQVVGLGTRFALEAERVVLRVQNGPDQFPVVYRTMRRALLRDFPYGVFFRANTSEIIVVAVVHLRRHPRRWQSRG